MTDPTTIARRDFLAALTCSAFAGRALVDAASTSKPRAPRWPAIQALLDGYVAAGQVAGASVAVSYGDPATPAYVSAGTIALDTPTRFDERSVCRVYSLTKPVTGVAAMLLVEDGRIALDQPVAEVLPEFRSMRVAVDLAVGLDARPAATVMTMRHLLTHTSGLSSWIPASTGPALLNAAYRERGITPGNFGARRTRAGYGEQAKSLEEMVARLAELPLAHDPGTASLYSIGTDVMALVIARASGRGYEAFLRERLFAPLGMDATGFQVRPEDVPHLTTNYDVTADGLVPTDPAATSVFRRPPTLVAGGGGLVSTARDFARFGAMLLGDGALAGARVMRAETARLARSNLLPPGVRGTNGGSAAGASLVLPGATSAFGPAGTVTGSGASGTLWWIDPARRGQGVYMAQTMGWGTPATYPVPAHLTAALAADLAAAGVR